MYKFKLSNLNSWNKPWIGVVVIQLFFTSYFFLTDFLGFVDFDSAAFQAIGLHVARGKILYKDVWDAKPPGIYFLNAVAFKVFGISQQSIWVLQWLLGLMHIYIFHLLGQHFFKSGIMAFMVTFLYITWFYLSDLYQGGNFTEEYATVFTLTGLVLLFTKKKSNVTIAFGGIFLTSAVFFKEPYLLTIIPWILYFAWKYYHENSRRLGPLIGGLLLPGLVLLIYLSATGSLFDFQKHLLYNIEYSKFLNIPLLVKVGKSFLFFKEMLLVQLPGINWLFLVLTPIFLVLKNNRLIVAVLVAEFIIGWVSISLSGYQFQHYFMQISPAIFLTLGILMGALIQLTSRKLPFLKHSKFIATFLCSALVLGWSFYILVDTKSKLGTPVDEYELILEQIHLAKDDSSTLFVQDLSHCDMYVKTELTSEQTIPVAFFTFFMVQDKYAVERIEKFVYSLIENPPTYILVGESSGILDKHDRIRPWFIKHYHLVLSESGTKDVLRLYKLVV